MSGVTTSAAVEVHGDVGGKVVVPGGLVVAVSGHRHLVPGSEGWVEAELERLMSKLTPSVAISGMALGVDAIWARIALAHGVALHAYVPFPEQSLPWRSADKAAYDELLSRAARVVTIAPTWRKSAYAERNLAMVDACELLVAVYDGRGRGGTAHCLATARAPSRDVVLVEPLARRTTLRRWSRAA